MIAALRTLTLTLLLTFLAGCASVGTPDETSGWSAEQLYSEGKEALQDGNYEIALELFSKLEARYPYGRYAQQAQLETIYAHYRAKEPAAAIAAAERFIKLHPRHPYVDYAYYMRGLASFYPGENFLERYFPQDKSQRDPQTARQAFNYFRELVTRFPRSRYSPDAVQRMTHLRNNLAEYELKVADYYLRRGAHLAAANRGKYVLENYPGAPAVPGALVTMIQAYRHMEMKELAADALRVLKQNYPAEAHRLLEKHGITDTMENGA